MKATIRITIAVVTGLFLLAGCVAGSGSTGPSPAVPSPSGPNSGSPGSPPSGSPASGPNPGGVVSLSLLTGFTGPDGSAYQALVQQFNATHPDVQVSMDVQPWDSIGRSLPGAWASGQGPDLATPGVDPGVIADYARADSVLPLDSAVGPGADQVNPGAWPASVTSGFTVGGHLYAAPADVAPVALYYNKAMFAAAGISGPPRTQADLITDAEKLTVGGARPSQYGIALADHETTQPVWPVLLWMNGGAILDSHGCAAITNPASVQALTTWSDLVQRNHISPLDQSGADADTLFAGQKAAMEFAGPRAAAGFRQAGVDAGIAGVPVGPGGPVTIASTTPLMVKKGTAHPAQALEFLSWWTSKTAQAAFSAASGLPPARTDVAVSDPNVGVFAAALPTARLYLAGLPQAPQLDSEVYAPLIRQISHGRNVQQSLNAAASAINELTGCKG